MTLLVINCSTSIVSSLITGAANPYDCLALLCSFLVLNLGFRCCGVPDVRFGESLTAQFRDRFLGLVREVWEHTDYLLR